MMTNKKTFGFGAVLLMAVSAGSVSAEEWDMTQERSQQRVRSELNLQASDVENARTRMREQKMKQEQNQYHKEYRYRNNSQSRQSKAFSGSLNRSSMASGSSRKMR